MKTIILTEPNSEKILNQYGPDLLEKLAKISELSIYNNCKNDFSNIPELFDDSEKILLFDPFSVQNNFNDITKALPSFTNLKYMFSPYSFYTGLDLELLKKLEIKYRNNTGVNSAAVSQFAITLMFMLLRKYTILAKLIKPPDGSILGEEIFSKSVGIIGMGNVGLELYKFLKKLDIQTTYYNRTDKHLNIEKVEFEKIFDQDIIFISLATNDNTIYLMKELQKYLRPHHYLIDITSFDELYDKQNIINMLQEDNLRGYALETDDTTKYKGNDKNLLVTPHMAWSTVEEETSMVRTYLGYAMDVLEGNADKINYLI